MVMGEEESVVRGCIKTSKGPWLVQKTNKDGGVSVKYRFPSERERLKNKHRERNRRAIQKKIFAGLRAHGNYQIPKHADTNDLLKALCEEGGWHVEEDGSVYKKVSTPKMPSLIDIESCHVSGAQSEYQDYCTCTEIIKDFQARTPLSMAMELSQEGSDLDLELSLS